MAIVNRDLDVTQQKDIYQVKMLGTTTNGLIVSSAGITIALACIPYACELESVRAYAQGVSGSPILQLYKNVYISGTGQTIYAMGVSGLVLANFASAGLLGASVLPASGSTTIQLNSGDVVIGVLSGANTALTELAVDLVVQKLADIVTSNGQQ